ncbi:MAG: non-ribosomal peptide synthetase [Acidobacteria bacterium]|nr:non-ribosomal peptide synthetase [Acidobacteriota bacterium]
MDRISSESAASISFGREHHGRTIPAFFEEVAARRLDQPAVKGDGAILTYGELNESADRLAWKLMELDGPANTPVALLLGHEPALVVGLLGVLKAGKAWVALDQGAPLQRQRLLLADAGARCLVTDRRNEAEATAVAPVGTRVVLMGETADMQSYGGVLSPVSPSSLACILYTSGTTGEPKGVAFRHDSILRKKILDTHAFRLTERDRIMCPFSANSVAGVGGMFRALLNGAILVLYDIRARGIEALPDWLRREGITVYHSVPTVFRRFARHVPPGASFPEPRLFLLAGEPLFSQDVDLFRRIGGDGSVLVNLFGCTEVPGYCWYALTRDTESADEIVPVGQTLPGTEIRLLGEDGHDVDAGAVGEIVVKSLFMAQGYWHGATGEPHIEEIRDRDGYFHTGDLGRWRSEGQLEHMGRRDHLVKIAGLRVSLTEVEAVFRDMAGVAEVAVVDMTMPDGSKQLRGLVVPAKHTPPDTAELRRQLRDRLPEVMIPTEIVVMSALPLTSTGKVDRAALQAAGPITAPSVSPPPKGAAEDRLAWLWMEILGLDAVGRQDDFFARGGDSLQAVRLISRIQAEFGVDLPVRIIFETPILTELAAFIQVLKACAES